MRQIRRYGTEFKLSSVGEDDIYHIYHYAQHFHFLDEYQMNAGVNFKARQQTQMDLS